MVIAFYLQLVLLDKVQHFFEFLFMRFNYFDIAGLLSQDNLDNGHICTLLPCPKSKSNKTMSIILLIIETRNYLY